MEASYTEWSSTSCTENPHDTSIGPQPRIIAQNYCPEFMGDGFWDLGPMNIYLISSQPCNQWGWAVDIVGLNWVSLGKTINFLQVPNKIKAAAYRVYLTVFMWGNILVLPNLWACSLHGPGVPISLQSKPNLRPTLFQGSLFIHTW